MKGAPSLKTARPLDDYTGEFHQPLFGTITIIKEGDGLTALIANAAYASMGHSLSTPLRYLGADVFEAVEERFKGYTLFFIPDRKGHLDSLAVKFKRADARETVFSRTPDASLLNESYLEEFTGQYISGDKLMCISLNECRVVLQIPGQAEVELMPRKEAEFNLRSIPGYHVEFERDESGAVCRAVVTEPNGVSRLEKVAAALAQEKAAH